MNSDEKAKAVVDLMYNHDAFSQWLGIERLSEGPGSSVLRMIIRKEMLNGFGIAHGSITFALADSALAFASNGHGQKCVSIDTQISHTKSCFENDVITATASEISRSRSLARYNVTVSNQKNETVALFRGTVFIKEESWPIGQ